MSNTASAHFEFSRDPVPYDTGSRLTALQVLLVFLLVALSAACSGGQGDGGDGTDGKNANPVVMFPQHDAPFTTDRGGQHTVVKLVLDGGCLRAEYPSLEVDPSSGARISRSELLVWPESFTLSTEDGVARVVDAYGRIAARVGDYVRITWADIRFQEARDQGLIHGLSEECPGPYWLIGDEVFAISLDGPSVLQLSDPELYFPLQPTVFGEHENLTPLVIDELVLNGHCLGLKSGATIIWPSGFTPYVYRGVVHVRNAAGQIIAEVGDRIAMGAGSTRSTSWYAQTLGSKCPGRTWAPSNISVLPKDEVYFPRQDGTLATDQGMERFVGKLVLEGRCLVVDRAVRVRDSIIWGKQLLIWPETFTLNLEENVVEIVDENGRVVARPGDKVQFSAAGISYREAIDHTGFREISPDCDGGTLVVGEDFAAVPDSESP